MTALERLREALLDNAGKLEITLPVIWMEAILDDHDDSCVSANDADSLANQLEESEGEVRDSREIIAELRAELKAKP